MNRKFLARTSVCLALGASLAVLVPTVLAVGPGHPDEHQERNFDARQSLGATWEAAPLVTQRVALGAMKSEISNLAVTFDKGTGATRTVYNRLGYLTPASVAEATAEATALAFVQDNLDLLGISSADLANYEVTDNVFSAVTGATHLYLRQTHQGLSVYNGQLHINVNRDGRIISVGNAFLPNLAASANSPSPTISAAAAVQSLADHLGVSLAASPKVLSASTDLKRETRLEAPSFSRSEIVAHLMWLPIRRGSARLVWNFQVETLDSQHWYDVTVDAHDGRVWTRFDWVASSGGGDSYLVSPLPFESLAHMPTPPPADGRTTEVDPADATASSLAWHNDGTTTYTITRGNNVNAYEDSNGSNSPSTPQPDCGATLDCSFDAPIDFGTQAPSTYQDAAVANLFYWNNVIHDVQYRYGFDEAAGNFQVDNFGNGGAGGDAVQAEAQDPGNCNANFATPPDGTQPRMQMFTCNNTTPARDGDFDNAVIVHEYGHGISIRLVGGPSNSGCLGNTQQPGEGLSDWWGLAYTAEVGDAGTDSRGIGTYLFGQPTDGPGIRPQPYSTDPAVNDYTYESMNGLVVPHGVGSVWAQVAWEAYWALVDIHGFSADFYDALGDAGNQRMMLYVNEGLKNTVCGPTFADVRDGIIQAATDNHGGEDVCTLWEVFGGFGIGTDAVTGGPGSTAPTNGFEIPVECLCDPGETIPIADAGDDQILCLGDSVEIGTPALPGHTYLWSPGGETTPQITVSPTETTEYTVTVTTDCGPKDDVVTVAVDTGVGGLSDDFESGTDGWTFDGLWHQVTDTTCTAPEPGYSSPLNSMYYGQDGTCTYNTGAATSGDLISDPIFGIDETSTLSFDYFRNVEFFAGSFDRTEVDVIAGGVATNVFALDTNTASTNVWEAEGPISLAAFAGQVIQLRFRFDTVDGVDNGFIGWLVDDVEVTGNSLCVSDAIFADGFESNDTTAWSATVP